MIVAGAVATAVYLVTFLAVLEVWSVHRRHSQRPWGWTGFRSRPEVPATGLTGIGFVVAVGTGLTASLLSWAGLMPTLQTGGTARMVLGVVIAAAGLILGLSARGTLSRHRPAPGSPQAVPFVTTGWFALIRNSLFTAVILTEAGATIIAISWLSVLALVLLIATCRWQVRSVEEPYRVRVHGQTYRTYAQHTGRFVPGIGRRLRSL